MTSKPNETGERLRDGAWRRDHGRAGRLAKLISRSIPHMGALELVASVYDGHQSTIPEPVAACSDCLRSGGGASSLQLTTMLTRSRRKTPIAAHAVESAPSAIARPKKTTA
jgi:hypothetical protein